MNNKNIPYIVLREINKCYIWYNNKIEISRQKRGDK